MQTLLFSAHHAIAGEGSWCHHTPMTRATKFLIPLALIILMVCGWWFYTQYLRISTAVHDQERQTTAAFLDAAARPYVVSGAFMSEDRAVRDAAFTSFFQDVQSPDLFRVKAWNRDYSIVWSDLADLIGTQYKDNQAVAEAFDGTPVLSIGVPKLEHVSERQLVQLLEVYAPVHDTDGNVVLVFETYTAGSPIPPEAGKEISLYASSALGAALILIFGAGFLLRRFIR